MWILSGNPVATAGLLSSDVVLRIKPVLLAHAAAAHRRAVILEGEQVIISAAALRVHRVIKHRACPSAKLDAKRLAHSSGHGEGVVHYFVLQRRVHRPG